MPSHRSSVQPYRIACLECQGSCLYAEVVQISDPPKRYWLRPLWLSVIAGELETPAASETSSSDAVYNVQGCADLLWPQANLRDALDMEILPLLTAFPPESIDAPEPLPVAKQQLTQFLHRLWQHQATLPSTDSLL